MDEMDDMDRQIAERKQVEEIRRIEEEAKKQGTDLSDAEVVKNIAEQKNSIKCVKQRMFPLRR